MSILSSSRVEIVLVVKIVIRKVGMLKIFPVGQILKKNRHWAFFAASFGMCILFVFIAENQINHVFPPRGVARGAGVLQTCKNSKRLQPTVKLWFGRQIKSSEKLIARYNITSFNESTMIKKC